MSEVQTVATESNPLAFLIKTLHCSIVDRISLRTIVSFRPHNRCRFVDHCVLKIPARLVCFCAMDSSSPYFVPLQRGSEELLSHTGMVANGSIMSPTQTMDMNDAKKVRKRQLYVLMSAAAIKSYMVLLSVSQISLLVSFRKRAILKSFHFRLFMKKSEFSQILHRFLEDHGIN